MIEKFCQEREILKRNQRELLELKNSVCQTETTVESHSKRLHKAEERKSTLEDSFLETSQSDKKRKRKLERTGNNIRDIWGPIK